LQKYHISVIAALMIFIVLVSVAGNGLLGLSRGNFLTNVNGLSPAKVTVGSMFFVFPNQIVLRNVIIKDEDMLPGQDVCVFKSVVIKFSLSAFFQRKLSVSDIIIGSPRWKHKNLSLFLKKHFYTIKAILEKRSRKDIRVLVRKGVWGLADRGNDAFYIKNDLILRLKGDTISGSGLLKKERGTFRNGKMTLVSKDTAWDFNFHGAFHAKGFFLDRLMIRKGRLYANLWGNQAQRSFRLNGFAFINPPSVPVAQRLAALVHPQLERVNLGQKNMVIRDIDAVFKLDLPDIEITHFHFIFNHVFSRLKGRLNFEEDLAFDLVCSIDNAPSGDLAMNDFKKADFKIVGDMKGNGLNGDGEVQIQLRAHPHGNVGVEKITSEMEGLRMDFDAYARLCVYLRKGSFAFWTNNNEHRLSFENLRASLSVPQPRFNIVQLDGDLYGGTVNGRLWFDSTRASLRTSAVGVFSNVDANQLDELLIHFSKVRGRLFSNVRLSMGPELNVDGEINIKNGRLQDFDFFNWIADNFALPSLKEIAFQKTAMDFFVNKESAGLNKIQMESEDLSIHGYFNIDKRELVSSKLSMEFQRGFLKHSAKLRRIADIFDEQVNAVIFNFQLSGSQHAMNFQWLDSDHKIKIRETIPDFIERMIERRVGKAMQVSLPEE
jgi:hypothetical protein